MSTSITSLERLPSREGTAPRAAWAELGPRDLPVWNERLLHTDASLLQYPYWNEPYRRVHLRPRYLTWGARAWVCVLTVGLPQLRIGLIIRGPVALVPGEQVPDEALRGLVEWARTQGFLFLRFTHQDQALLERIALLGRSDRCDAFPFYQGPLRYHELIVDQLPDDGQMLAGFDREARRKIRRAEAAEYCIRFSDSPESLKEVWPLFAGCARRKGFRLNRPLASHLDLMRLARPYQCACLCTVELKGKPVGACLTLRDRTTAWCLLAALDPDALQGRPSPSVLMHWRVMRDLYRVGVVHYNFGPGVGGVGQFKQQFAPRRSECPPPVCLAINERLYVWWLRGVLPVFRVVELALRTLAGGWSR